LQRSYPNLFENRKDLTLPESKKPQTIAQRKLERDKYWTQLLFNMADGNMQDMEVLNGLDVFEFYARFTIWEKRLDDQLRNADKPVAKARTSRR